MNEIELRKNIKHIFDRDRSSLDAFDRMKELKKVEDSLSGWGLFFDLLAEHTDINCQIYGMSDEIIEVIESLTKNYDITDAEFIYYHESISPKDEFYHENWFPYIQDGHSTFMINRDFIEILHKKIKEANQYKDFFRSAPWK